MIISPLLALMRNQIHNASKLGLNAATINSSNVREWDIIEDGLLINHYDLLLVSPERLSNDRFIHQMIPKIGRIDAFVVDEVHCISDWGHDFRPDYRRIKMIINQIFSGVPVIGTTATANNRVIRDLEQQFGGGIHTMRGDLARKGLKLQKIVLPTIAERLALLADIIPSIPGSGIVYCLTRGDVYRVALWLKHCGINCHYYWGGNVPGEENKDLSEELETKLLNNEIKVLVATSALGMGYDKPDLSFVIHYQSPGSAISYYQQVGRAGRAVEESYGLLLYGGEDDEILDFFLNEAFPSEDEERDVLAFLDGVVSATAGQIKKKLNIKDSRLEKALKHLLVDGYISKDKSTYTRTVKRWYYDTEKRDKLKECRIRERERMRAYLSYEGCLMNFITNELDDDSSQDCGICFNCRGELLPTKPTPANINKALTFLNQDYAVIPPRKRWPSGLPLSFNKKNRPTTKIESEFLIRQGRALCYLENAGWGTRLSACFRDNRIVDEDAVLAAYHLITEKWQPLPFPEWVTFIPSSRRNKLIRDFAFRISKKLDLPMLDCIYVQNKEFPMKHYKNSHQIVENCINCWRLTNISMTGPVLLVDDFINTGWTFTIAGKLLKEAGIEAVYPFALASKNKDL